MIQYRNDLEVISMSKIICDICGTTYPETAECCPICGCSQDAASDFLGSEVIAEEENGTPATESARTSVRKKEIFDFDEVNSPAVEEEDDEEEDLYDEEEDEEESGSHNTFVIILLTLLIIALLGAAGFIFLRYFLPNMNEKETVPAATVMQTEAPVESTELTIPCDHMVMINAGVAELNAEGQQFLLHIKAMPEDTTDKIVYTSGDESIATVSEDGKITAVAEGETIVYISCGIHSIECPVIGKFVEETVPPTTAETEAVSVSAVPEESEGDGEAGTPEETEAIQAPVMENSNVTLKLKKTDIRLGVYYQYQLELDCELNPEDVTWSSEHPHIA